MKKGFFLLEALLACTLLALLVGSVMHHYAQWSRSYRNAIQQGKALAVLMTLIEQRVDSCPGSELYTITTKKISVNAPTGSLVAVPTIVCPLPQCIEITASWQDDRQSTVSAVVGGMRE